MTDIAHGDYTEREKLLHNLGFYEGVVSEFEKPAKEKFRHAWRTGLKKLQNDLARLNAPRPRPHITTRAVDRFDGTRQEFPIMPNKKPLDQLTTDILLDKKKRLELRVHHSTGQILATDTPALAGKYKIRRHGALEQLYKVNNELMKRTGFSPVTDWAKAPHAPNLLASGTQEHYDRLSARVSALEALSRPIGGDLHLHPRTPLSDLVTNVFNQPAIAEVNDEMSKEILAKFFAPKYPLLKKLIVDRFAAKKDPNSSRFTLTTEKDIEAVVAELNELGQTYSLTWTPSLAEGGDPHGTLSMSFTEWPAFQRFMAKVYAE